MAMATERGFFLAFPEFLHPLGMRSIRSNLTLVSNLSTLEFPIQASEVGVKESIFKKRNNKKKCKLCVYMSPSYRVSAYECRFFEARSRPQIPRAGVTGSCGWLDMAAATKLRSSARRVCAHK